MKIEALEAMHPYLKSEFPELFIFLFKGGGNGELNEFGKLAEELYHLRRKPQHIPETESPVLKHLFDTLPIVFKESIEDERKRLDLGEEEDKGQWTMATNKFLKRKQDDKEV